MDITDPFSFCLEKIFVVEGGLTNDSEDPGGLTNWGISEAAFPGEDISSLSKARASVLYRRHYWEPIRGGNLWSASPPMTLLTFDSGVNHGVGTGIKLLQRALRVREDGLLGPETLNALLRSGPEQQLRFLVERGELYLAIIAKRPPMVKFRKGWFRRLYMLSRWAEELEQWTSKTRG